MLNGQGVVPDQPFAQDPLITDSRHLGLGEVVGEVGPDKVLAQEAGRLLGRRVDVGDLALRADRDQRVKARLDQAAGVKGHFAARVWVSLVSSRG